jgi:hypothetical protein
LASVPLVVAIDARANVLSLSSLILGPVLKLVLKLPDFDVPYWDNLTRTSDATWRKNGRRMAAEAAMIPVPGSAVAQMVALMDSATAR